ncbi:hypothetical protein LEMLEM_LOCUS15851, partial [Lemmus lemmus]
CLSSKLKISRQNHWNRQPSCSGQVPVFKRKTTLLDLPTLTSVTEEAVIISRALGL